MRASTRFFSVFGLQAPHLARSLKAYGIRSRIARHLNVPIVRIRSSGSPSICLLAILLVLSGCGGGGNSAPNPAPTPTPAPDFTLSASPAQINIGLGFAQNVTVSVAQSGSVLSAPIAVTISGLPSGVTATPSTFNLSVGGPQAQTVALTASS
jgi:hypothetical protein